MSALNERRQLSACLATLMLGGLAWNFIHGLDRFQPSPTRPEISPWTSRNAVSTAEWERFVANEIGALGRFEIPSDRRSVEQIAFEETAGFDLTAVLAAFGAGLDRQLTAIEIEGNETIATDEIMKHIESRAGKIVSPTQVADDVRKLMETRHFFRVTPTVKASDGGPVLILRVIERPVVRSVAFVGNRAFSAEVLSELVAIHAGSAYVIQANQQAAERIESHYHSAGYGHATVELEKGDEPGDREVVFRIDEGAKSQGEFAKPSLKNVDDE